MEENTENIVKRILQSGDLYTVLDLKESASVEDVERSFNFLVNEVNLDRILIFPDGHKALKVLEKAYETLTDHNNRESYDYILQITTDDEYQSEQQTRKQHEQVPEEHTEDDKVFRKQIRPFFFLLQLLLSAIFILMIEYSGPEYNCAENHYQILGVSSLSNTITIRKAYRKVLRELHPDKKTLEQDTDKFYQFKKIEAAYKVLSKYEKRLEYDIECETVINKVEKISVLEFVCSIVYHWVQKAPLHNWFWKVWKISTSITFDLFSEYLVICLLCFYLEVDFLWYIVFLPGLFVKLMNREMELENN